MKQQKSGVTKVESEQGIEELTPGDGVQIDAGTKYEYGADLHTEGAPLIDAGTGKTISIRVFDFAMNPTIPKNAFRDRQAIFNHHSKQIATILWSDGLRPLEEFPPRVIIDAKRRTYKIFVPCEARLHQNFIESPRNLAEHLTTKNGTTRH